MIEPVSSSAPESLATRPREYDPGLPPPVLPGYLPKRSVARLRMNLLAKSIVDRCLAVAMLIVGLPLMGISMLLVKITSRGPALYSQKRVGQYGRVFTLYKIRTMYHNCENTTGPRWSTPGDPRVTWIGNILRKLHLDELPQLWNVLRGEMSLIGPRPERPEIAGKLLAAIPDYNWRVAMKPGISGQAQINLPPDTSVHSVRNKMVHDRFYIKMFTVFLDLKILVCTGLKIVGLYRQKNVGS